MSALQTLKSATHLWRNGLKSISGQVEILQFCEGREALWKVVVPDHVVAEEEPRQVEHVAERLGEGADQVVAQVEHAQVRKLAAMIKQHLCRASQSEYESRSLPSFFPKLYIRSCIPWPDALLCSTLHYCLNGAKKLRLCDIAQKNYR
jgi:hypothetical protein